MEPLWIFFIAGALGALANDILKDNIIELPKIVNGNLVLGCLGGLIIGGFAGYYIDGNLSTAFMGGFVGKAVLQGLMPTSVDQLLKKKKKEEEKTKKSEEKKTNENETIEEKKTNENETIEEMIRRIARLYKIDEELAVKVAKCESALNPNAINENNNGTIDRGLYQWNNYYHSEITKEIAFDPEKSTIKFCEAVKNGHLDWWNCSKKCWDK
jgi:hypothetical protein